MQQEGDEYIRRDWSMCEVRKVSAKSPEFELVVTLKSEHIYA